MRFVSVRDLRTKSADVWKNLAKEGEMVVTNNGKPVAILAAVNESNLEETLSAFRRTRTVEAVARLQRRSEERGAGKITIEEIDEEIASVRRQRGQ